MPNQKKVLIVEFSLGHFELIPSHLYFLEKRNYEVFYAGLDQGKDAISEIIGRFSNAIFISKPKNINQLLIIRKFIQQENIGQVLFNSASGRSVLLLTLLVSMKLHLCGVLHDIEKLNNSNTQRIISFRIKHYLTLSRFLKQKAQRLSQRHFEFFYPIYFGNYGVIKKENKKIRIVIPGHIQKVRRDYVGFINAIGAIPIQILRNFKIILLGNIGREDGKEVKNIIKHNGVEEVFEYFNSHVHDSQFHSELIESDYVMPLIHPSVFKYNKYDEYKISGAYNLAFGHKKPLLIHDDLKKIKEFDGISIFYNLESLQDIFTHILATNTNELVSNYSRDERFHENLQEKRFFSIVK